MKVYFDDPKLALTCSRNQLLTRTHGTEKANIIRQILDNFASALSLDDFTHSLPGNLRAIDKHLPGFFEINAGWETAVLFRVEPLTADCADWTKIDSISITSIGLPLQSMENRPMYEPDIVSPPGQVLHTMCRELYLSQAELNDKIGYKHGISPIVQGLKLLPDELISCLCNTFGMSAEFWRNRNAAYAEAIQRAQTSK